jgi:cytochrome oxidase Cu insertion factor (SCO1/SenC/PrrC family)
VHRHLDWDGKALMPKFEVDFLAEKLGRPYHMKFLGSNRKGFARYAGSYGAAVTRKMLGALLQRRAWKVAAAAQILAAALALADAATAGLLPPPGSYKLNHIQRVPQAIVLEGTRFPRLLSHYTKGAVTLLGFFYSTCADPNGCPLAWEAFEKARGEILARPQLYGHVRLVFISLDPKHDTPGVLSDFARHYEAGTKIVPWHFLTTYSYFFLEPLLRDMGKRFLSARKRRAMGR